MCFFRLVFICGSNCIYCFILYLEVLNCQEVKLSINTALSILPPLPNKKKKKNQCLLKIKVFLLYLLPDYSVLFDEKDRDDNSTVAVCLKLSVIVLKLFM